MSTQDTTYNGWANYETWNVALHIGNDRGLYSLAKTFSTYERFVRELPFDCKSTSDGVAWNDPSLDIEALDKMIGDL